jgi:hypothetical protein
MAPRTTLIMKMFLEEHDNTASTLRSGGKLTLCCGYKHRPMPTRIPCSGQRHGCAVCGFMKGFWLNNAGPCGGCANGRLA